MVEGTTAELELERHSFLEAPLLEIEKAAITVSRARHTRAPPAIKDIGHTSARPRRCPRRSTRVLRAKRTVQNSEEIIKQVCPILSLQVISLLQLSILSQS